MNGNGNHARNEAASNGGRCVIYVRISKDRADETSTTTQREECEAYAAEQGWTIVGTFEDAGRSAFDQSVKREGFDNAMRLVETGAANRFLVWKLDRFMRSAMDFVTHWQRIEKFGGQFASKCEPWFDTSTAIGRMMLLLMATVAEIESEARRDRAIPWNNYRKRKGYVPTGPRPYGYTRSRNALTVNEDEANVIRWMADDVLDGTGINAIARSLNETNTPTASGKGQWNGVTVKRILVSPTTAGLRQLADGSFRDDCQWLPILDRATFDALRGLLLAEERSAHMNGHSNKLKYVLSGYMRCADCDIAIQSKNHTQGKRYQCPSCSVSIGVDVADAAIDTWIADAIDEDAWNEVRMRGRTAEPQAAANLQARFATIRAMYLDGLMTEDEYRDAHEDLRERIAKLESSPAARVPDVDDLRAAWPTMDVAAKRLVVEAVTESVTLVRRAADINGRDRIVIT